MKRTNHKIPMIYVAHPYNNDPANADKVAKTIKRLYQTFRNTAFVSPIHGICCDYEKTDYPHGLAYCLELLSRCDGLLVLGDKAAVAASKGVNAEMAFAILKGLPITRAEDWGLNHENG